MTALRWPAIDQSLHESPKRVHVEGAVFHVVGDVVGPRLGELFALFVTAVIHLCVVSWLSLLEQFDGFVNPLRGVGLVAPLLCGQSDDTNDHREREESCFPHDLRSLKKETWDTGGRKPAFRL